MLFFDLSAVHHPPPGYIPPTPVPPPAEIANQEPDVPTPKPDPPPEIEAKQEDLRDIPPLREYKDIDDEVDSAKLTLYNKEFNIWLIAVRDGTIY